MRDYQVHTTFELQLDVLVQATSQEDADEKVVRLLEHHSPSIYKFIHYLLCGEVLPDEQLRMERGSDE